MKYHPNCKCVYKFHDGIVPYRVSIMETILTLGRGEVLSKRHWHPACRALSPGYE